jgi:DNA-binding Lrp family transcriptional regulator
MMINAYILIAMQPGDYEKAVQSMRKIENIAKISIVAGDFDIVVRAQVDDLEQLLQVTDKIQLIDGVMKTTTQVIEKELSV